jgi:hypothetical protein
MAPWPRLSNQKENLNPLIFCMLSLNSAASGVIHNLASAINASLTLWGLAFGIGIIGVQEKEILQTADCRTKGQGSKDLLLLYHIDYLRRGTLALKPAEEASWHIPRG